MTLQTLRERRAEIVSQMEGILTEAEENGRADLDETEAELYAELEQELGTVKASIERREALHSERTSLDEIKPAASRGTRSAPAPEAKKEFDNIGEFIGAVVRSARGKGDDQRLEWCASEQRMDEGESGGFMVPTQFREQLLEVQPQAGMIRGRANVIPAGSPPDASITMPALDQTGDTPGNVYGGVEVNWIGEGDAKPDTKANFREVTLTPKELAANVPLTDKIIRNAPAMSSIVERLLRGALLSAQDHAFLSGDGVNRPLGILNAGATFDLNRASSGTIGYADIADMVGRLLMDGSPYWLASQSVYSTLAQITDGDNRLIWQPNAVEGSPGSLMGYPVFWHQRSPLLGDKGDLTLVNSNPYYLIKDGSGPFVAAGHAGNDFTNNVTRIKVFTNVDGAPWLTEPFTQEGGFQVSPFVALDVPS